MLAQREQINKDLRVKLDEVTERWGVKVTAVEIRRNGRVVRRGRIQPLLGWYATIPALPIVRPRSRRHGKVGAECDLEILTSQPIDVLLELNRG